MVDRNEDAVLVQRSAAGDTQAFGTLYQRYAVIIYRFIAAQVSDHYKAEDLTSEVFIRAWESLSGYQERGFPFSAYLFRIARNAVIDYRRKSRLSFASISSLWLLSDDSPGPKETMATIEENQFLQAGLEKIREDYRTVLVLRFINELSTSEVAKIMDRSEGAVRVLQHRALNALKKKLKQQGYGLNIKGLSDPTAEDRAIE